MRWMVALFLIGCAGMFAYAAGWQPFSPAAVVDPWSKKGLAQKNAELLHWDGLIAKAAAGTLKGNPAIKGEFADEDLAKILRAVSAEGGASLAPLASVYWDEEASRALVVVTGGWVWVEGAEMAGGSGQNFYVEKKQGSWVVVDRSFWMS